MGGAPGIDATSQAACWLVKIARLRQRRAGMTRNKVTKFLLAGIAGFALLPIDSHGAVDRRAAEAEAKMTAGEELSERGQFEEAIARWREAERAFAKAKDVDGEMRALLREASAC